MKSPISRSVTWLFTTRERAPMKSSPKSLRDRWHHVHLAAQA